MNEVTFSVHLNFFRSVQPGANNIVRQSSDSSVTIPSENYFQPEALSQKINENTATDSTYCLTGWPSHLLIPKGTPEGDEFLLFAMISKDDKVNYKYVHSFTRTNINSRLYLDV